MQTTNELTTTSFYQRSEVLNFFELDTDQQIAAKEDNDSAEDDSFVLWINKDDSMEVLPLSMFMRTSDSCKRFNGVYGLSAFSAYFITLSKCGTSAIVTYQYC